ncbi:MAG: PqqD family protein [Deltaproteobacteria bacterium]|nr:PqqD family protein [Deltaproteobacteria bacterium]MBW1815668.1 PqqD family protein [Deltaproteobacteria bacterium]
MITADSCFLHNEAEVAAEVMDGDAVLINLSTGVYYSISGSGGGIWSFLASGQSLRQIADSVAEHYDVDPDRARADVEKLISRLLQENIISIAGTEANEDIDHFPSHGNKQTYETPELKIYRDMSDLLALDPPMPNLSDIPWREPNDLSSDIDKK